MLSIISGASQRALRTRRRFFLRALRNAVTELLLPPICPCCAEAGAARADLCVDCRTDLIVLDEGESRLLLRGQGIEIPCRSLYRYRGTGGRLVRRLKLERDPAALGVLGRALARGFPRQQFSAQLVIVPVPLHAMRRRARGFNQAELLALWIARRTGAPICPRALRRVRNTTPQGPLSEEERAKNLRAAFEPGREFGRLEGGRVLLVDDVVTTGVTLLSCAAAISARIQLRSIEAVSICSAFRSPS